jgi:hypothetical protein
MRNKNFLLSVIGIIIGLCVAHPAYSQDKVYMTKGKVLNGKVTEVAPNQIKMLLNVRPDGPVYVIYTKDIDSIVYSNGLKDEMQGAIRKRELKENIPELNTWTFDLLGFTFLSVSQSYERRLKNGWLGFRVPLYIGFEGGSIAGVGTFTPGEGVFYPASNGVTGGFSIATGINPKFYFFDRRIVRVFAGPEVTIGYSEATDYSYNNSYYNNFYTYPGLNRNGTVAALIKAGLSINPIDKFNITIDGGAGIGDIFGGLSPYGAVGLWHIGLALGTNF